MLCSLCWTHIALVYFQIRQAGRRLEGMIFHEHVSLLKTWIVRSVTQHPRPTAPKPNSKPDVILALLPPDPSLPDCVGPSPPYCLSAHNLHIEGWTVFVGDRDAMGGILLRWGFDGLGLEGRRGVNSMGSFVLKVC